MTIEQPLQELSDRLQILNLLAGSALSSDVSSELYQRHLYSKHAVLDRHEETPNYHGRDSIAGIMRDADHVAQVESGLLHLASQTFVRITNDTAVACGYLQVLRPYQEARPHDGVGDNGVTKPEVWMITANVWRFERIDGEWLIVHRKLRDALSEDGRALIRGVLEQA